MSLRTKQSLILLLATVIPFALGAAAVELVVAPAYRAAVYRASVELTQRLVEHAAWNLGRDVSRLVRLSASRDLRAWPPRLRRSPAEARALERRWPAPGEASASLKPLLENPAAEELRWWRQTNPGFLEVFATDTRGYVVAAASPPSDFLHADEAWWRHAYAQGRGRTYVSELIYDPDEREWVVEVAVPIFTDDTPGAPVVGVLKATLAADVVFQDVRIARIAESGAALLVAGDGQVVLSSDASAAAERLPEPLQRRAQSAESGVFRRREAGEDSLYAWASVSLLRYCDVRLTAPPTLRVATRRSAEEAFGPLHLVQRSMLAIAVITICFAVLLGRWLAELLVVRHVRDLAAGMRELAEGDFEAAAARADDLLRRYDRGEQPADAPPGPASTSPAPR